MAEAPTSFQRTCRETGGHNSANHTKEGIAMRKTSLAVVISSVLLAAVAAQAEPVTDTTSPPAPSTSSQVDTTQPPATSASPEADAASGSSSNEGVGSGKSNVDEHSSSGSYYPYSSGTAGDDPSEPTSTRVEPDSGVTSGPTDQWQTADADRDGYLSLAELTTAAPTLASSFDAMDVDDDEKLTRAEFRTWHESHKARMDADQGTSAEAPKGTSTASPPANSDTTDSTSTPDAASSSAPPDEKND
jgi:hypothetical protein